MLVNVDEFEARFPRILSAPERARVTLLLADGEALIRGEFARRGQDFDTAVAGPWLLPVAQRVLRQMVAAAVLVGADAGRRSASSTVGALSESFTFAGGESALWGELVLTDEQRTELGLPVGAGVRFRFPRPMGWPERRS